MGATLQQQLGLGSYCCILSDNDEINEIKCYVNQILQDRNQQISYSVENLQSDPSQTTAIPALTLCYIYEYIYIFSNFLRVVVQILYLNTIL